MVRRYIAVGILLATIAWLAPSAHAETEPSLDLDARIRIDANGTAEITETIRIIGPSGNLKLASLYRSLRADYRDRFGERYSGDFEIVGVMHDGRRESYRTEKSLTRGLGLRVGANDAVLRPGTHVSLAYRTRRLVSTSADHDEFRWSITGRAWGPPILKATIVVESPPGAVVQQQAAFVKGLRGERRGVLTSKDPQGNPVFAINSPLTFNDALIVSLTWQKGIVHEPTFREAVRFLIVDEPLAAITVGGLLLLLVYCVLTWLIIGRDPPGGNIYPRFEPPADMSAAACRLLARMENDPKVLAVSLITCAIHGYIRIEQRDGLTTLRRLPDATDREPSSTLTSDEVALLKVLFEATDTIQLTRQNRKFLSAIQEALGIALTKIPPSPLFLANTRYVWIGALIWVAVGIAGAVVTASWFSLFTLLLAAWPGGLVSLATELFQRMSSRQGWGALFSAHRLIGWAVAGVLAAILIGFLFSWFTCVASLSAGVLLAWFFKAIRARTKDGRRLLDEIAGLKLYLSAGNPEARAHSLALKRSRTWFEVFLPYAIALDVHEAWARQFDDVLKASPDSGNAIYAPVWYVGTEPLSPVELSSFLGESFVRMLYSAMSASGVFVAAAAVND